MPDLSTSQEELRQSIQKSAVTWAVILAVVGALIAYWIMGGQPATIRMASAGVLGLGAGFGVYRWIFASRARSARCEKCSAAFSISRSDRAETLISSDEREEREPQDDGSVKISRWVEEKFDVVDTYTCANCDNVTTKQQRTTRRRDEESVVEAAPAAKVATKLAGSTGARRAKAASKGVSTQDTPTRTTKAASKGAPARAAPRKAKKATNKTKNTDSDSSAQ